MVIFLKYYLSYLKRRDSPIIYNFTYFNVTFSCINVSNILAIIYKLIAHSI